MRTLTLPACSPNTTPLSDQLSMPKKERAAKDAAFAMAKELDTEMTEEEAARLEKKGMGLFGGVNKGEEVLFGA